ncbi:hypothetical protein LCGC14_2016430 [marine sediment metagenome]|uniref:Uncharacterized protein n=1 Tax=marine sediment metagenome TaxID=412755 RepID=A0A0F9EYX1_9ZZZZ
MFSFNSYVVFDKEGFLIAQARSSSGGANSDPKKYFGGLSRDIQCQAYILFVFQKGGYVARYIVTQSNILVPTLGSRETLFSRGAKQYDERL